MKIELNEDKFDERQNAFVEILVEAIKGVVEDNEVEKDEVECLTADLTFRVCALLDCAEIVKKNKMSIVPHLAFRETEDCDNLITVDGESWMHEYAHGFVVEVFERDLYEGGDEDVENDEAEEEVDEDDVEDITRGSYSVEFTFPGGVILTNPIIRPAALATK